MRALVDVTHPAHVHLFRPTITALEDRGHEVRVVSREKDVTTDLLDAYDIDHTILSRKRPGILGVAREWLTREARLFRFARSFDPDLFLSRLNPATAHVSTLLDAPNLVFHDTEMAGALHHVTIPWTTMVCTPDVYEGEFGARHQRYAGFQELAYLHPARFEPDPGPVRAAGIDPDAHYSVVRLVGKDAHHDAGTSGFSPAAIRDLVDDLSAQGEVYISSEHPLPDAFAAYENPVSSINLHHLLAFADTYVGDSATMATEAALLGTPAVRYNPFDEEMGVFENLADRGLVMSVGDEQTAVEAAVQLAADPDAGGRWRRRRRHLLAEKIDVTAYIVELAEEVGGA